jgi:hypothetical protein
MKTLFFALSLAAVIAAEFVSFATSPAPDLCSPQLSKHRRDAGDDESKEEDFKVALAAR